MNSSVTTADIIIVDHIMHAHMYLRSYCDYSNQSLHYACTPCTVAS